MILCKVHYNWNKHWERFLFIGLENVEEVIIFEKAHCSIGDVKVRTSDALDESGEKSLQQRLVLSELLALDDL